MKKSIETINAQREKLNILRGKIDELSTSNNMIIKEKSDINHESQKVNHEFKDLMELNRSMVTSIRTLEQENKVLLVELENLKQRKVCDMYDKCVGSSLNDLSDENKINNETFPEVDDNNIEDIINVNCEADEKKVSKNQ